MVAGTSAFEQWRESGNWFQHRGQRIFFRESGKPGHGPALLCLHGFPTASWDWRRLWPALGERFAQVLAPDFIGLGWSAKPRRWRYSVFDQANLVETLLRERGVTDCHVLSHDYGDTVAQELLARHVETHEAGSLALPVYLDKLDEQAVRNSREGTAQPPRLLSLCFLNGGLFPETHRALPIQKLLLTPLGRLIAALTDESSFARKLSAVFAHNRQPTSIELDEFWQLMSSNGGHRVMHRLLRYIPERRANRRRWVGAMQATQVPLRLIDGPEDPVSGAHMVERYRQVVPNPDVVVLPGAGHYPQLEDAQGTLAAFLQFHTARG